MINEIYYIAYAGDNNYAMQIGVSMYSLFESNKNLQFRVYIFSDGISEENLNKFQSIADEFSQEIMIAPMPDLNELGEADLSTHNWAISTYCRMFFTKLLPDGVEKILWLDGDTLVVSDISTFFKTDIDNYACAGVIDSVKDFKVFNGFKYSEKYFNAGVLMINLKYWREHHIYEDFILEIKRRNGKSIDPDQSYINCGLKGKIKLVSPKYNLMHNFFAAEDKTIFNRFLFINLFLKKEMYDRNEILDAIENPVIYHYAGIDKSRPWVKNCSHPAADKWKQVLRHTPWKDYELREPNYPPKSNPIIRRLKMLLCGIPCFRILYVRSKYGFWQKWR